METNFVMRFHSLTDQGVVIGTFDLMKKTYGYPYGETMQSRPDLLGYFKNSTYAYRGYLGIDQKYQSPSHYGRQQAIYGI